MANKFELLSQMRNNLKDIFLAGVESVKPQTIIKNKIKIKDNKLLIDNIECIELNNRNVYIIGFGKAVMGMSMAMEDILGHRLKSGIVSIPRGSINNNKMNKTVVNYRENGKNNQPDEETLATTRDIIGMMSNLDKNDIIIVLISGGGSALLTMPIDNISLSVKLNLCKKLQNAGADIKQVNIVRQKLSMVKAGGLAKFGYPASIVGLIFSDIIDDPLEYIASGPTVYSQKHPDKIIEILNKYQIYNNLSDELKNILTSQCFNQQSFKKHVNNYIICNNKVAIEAAKQECQHNKNLNAIVLFDNLEGRVEEISKMYCKLTKIICQVWSKSITVDDFKKNSIFDRVKENNKVDEILELIQNVNTREIIIICGGEPSIVVSGSGKGGRNQHLALSYSLDLTAAEFKEKEENLIFNKYEIMFLSAGTDGQDGPTDAAGAFGYAGLIESRKEESTRYLHNNDSYTFYKNNNNGRDLLKIGLTGTNVMDMHFIYIHKKTL